MRADTHEHFTAKPGPTTTSRAGRHTHEYFTAQPGPATTNRASGHLRGTSQHNQAQRPPTARADTVSATAPYPVRSSGAPAQYRLFCSSPPSISTASGTGAFSPPLSPSGATSIGAGIGASGCSSMGAAGSSCSCGMV